MQTKVLTASAILVISALACRTGPVPTITELPTQTARVVQVTTTPLPTHTALVVVVSPTANATTLCVSATEAVYLRPSPGTNGYPIKPLPNGSRVDDLGGRNGDWVFVEFGAARGWVHGNYLQDCGE